MAKSRDTDYLCHNGLSLAFTRHGCAMLLQVDIIKEQPMNPFARINLSSVLSSVALAKGDALRRGILVSSLALAAKNGSVATKNTKGTKK